MADELGITIPVLIDEMDNPVWCTYGPAPNIAYLIGTDGRTAEKQGWYQPELMKAAIETYLAGAGAPSPSQVPAAQPQSDNQSSMAGAASPPAEILPALPDPETDNFTCTLPTGASPLRLSLPADIEDIFYSEKTGVGGFGLHSGGHIEGLDHVWIELRPGTPVRSWADGVVEDVRLSGDVDAGEYHITINYGQNLIGIHMEIETPYVKKGDQVKRGQEVGTGMSYDPEQASAELSLIDLGRTDGVRAWNKGVYVSPYDYLEGSDKKRLVEAYKKYVIEPYQEKGSREGLFDKFRPYQPYLTNKLFLHEGNKGKLSGAWYCLSSKWEQGYPNDILTFIEADNPYYKGNVVLAADDRDEGRRPDWSIEGTFEVDYEKGQVKIINYDGTVYYGIFEIDEGEERAKLKIEYQKGSYPAGFSSNALIYIERSDNSRRGDASNLGVLDSG